jgi:hypothetical protein
VDLGELVDQGPVILIGRSIGSSPGEAGNFVPGRCRRPSLMADQVSGVDQAGPMMAGDAMEKDWPSRRVCEQIRGLGHLFHGCS